MSVISAPTGYFGCLSASAAGNPSASVVFQVPHAARASDVKPHLHVVKDDASDNTGTAPFQAKFRVCNLHGTCGAWSADWVTGTVIADDAGSSTTPDGADTTFLVAWTLAYATYAFTPSSLIVMQLQRNGGTSGTVAVCSVDLHYQRNALGGSVHEGRR